MRDKDDDRILLGVSTGIRVVIAAAGKVPVCWGLDFDWTSLHTHTSAYLTIRVPDTGLRKNQLGRTFRSQKYRVSQGVAVLMVNKPTCLRLISFW